MTLSVYPLCDPSAVDRILKHPAIDPKIRHDGREPGYIEHPLARYYGAYVDGRLVGVFLAVRFSDWEVEVHTGILPEAVRHGRALSRLFLAELFKDPEVARVTAYVLSTLPSAANFCRRLGFEDEGRRRNAVRVDGVLADVVVLGMVRDQFRLSSSSMRASKSSMRD